MNKLKLGVFILSLYYCFTLQSCNKETDCVRCDINCITFYSNGPFYCLYDFNDSLQYVNFVDSMLQLYTLKDTFLLEWGTCDDIQSFKDEKEAQNWRCRYTKEQL